MSELTIISHYEMDPRIAASSMHDFVAQNHASLVEAGFINLVDTYTNREPALQGAVARRAALLAKGVQPFFVYDEHMKVGVATILPRLELLGPANGFTARMPRAVQKRMTRYPQQVVIPAEESVNVVMFISPDYLVDADGAAGSQVVRFLTSEARKEHAGKTAWALVAPHASIYGNNREGSYLRNDYAVAGVERYDDREPVFMTLPITKLVTKTL